MTFNIFGKEIYLRKAVIVITVFLLTVTIGSIGVFINKSYKDGEQVVFEKQKDETIVSANITSISTSQSSDFKQMQEKDNKTFEEIKVYVTGCVKLPGIVSIKKDQLINDAIEAAGGATNNADLNNINLVYKLKENVMIYIKSKDETKVVNKAGEAGKGVDIIKDSAGAIVNSPENAQSSKGKVNINIASADELDTLPGVGKETAKDIISYREKNKQFKNIKDVMQVPGIKESKFNKIKDFITVE